MEQYFSNKNYRMLYYDSFFKTFANGIYSVFTPVILYKSGVSITMIISIYMIQFLIMGLFTPLAGTFLIKNNNLVIIISVVASYLIAYLALLNLDKACLNYKIDSSFKESYKYLFSKNENELLKKVSGLRSFIIIERLIAVPVYLYISIIDLKTFISLYVISTIIELLSLFITGNRFDKDKQKTFNIISIIKEIISSIFIFAKNTYVLMINQSLYKLVDNVYDSSYSALSQSKVENDKKDTLLL